MLVQGNTVAVSHSGLSKNEMEVWSAVWVANNKYPNISMDLLLDLADWECKLNIPTEKCVGDSGKAVGRWQWWQSSWDIYNKKFGTNLNRNNTNDQAVMTARVILDGGIWNWKNYAKAHYSVLGDLIK